jgi:UDP-N-acetylglucosamine--N-acetylmuramyl-(pentapeptide) pyrophosphoryl-undecaprenol N-acetylglucosamine transferase
VSGDPVFVFAGGGTGGHLFPGLAIAEEIVKRQPEARCVFLCSDRAIDTQILGSAQLAGRPVEFIVLPAKPAIMRPIGLARFLASWGPSVRKTRALLRKAGGPAKLISMGGFVAAPAVRAALAEHVPVVLVNLDAVPGKANRWIARRARHVFTAVVPVQTYGRVQWVEVPPIVRAGGLASRSAAECRRMLGLDPAKPTLLVTGASQGAGSINRMMVRFVGADASRLVGWQVVHQTGREGVEEVRSAYQGAGIPALVEPFFDTMGLAWGAADLAVSRAGAGSVAEAWANHIPTIFLPYPYHKDEHQRFNALPLEEAGGAIVVTDRIDPAANLAEAGAVLAARLADEAARWTMRRALHALGPADGAARVAAGLV